MPRANGAHKMRKKDLPPTGIGPRCNEGRPELVAIEARRAEALKLKADGWTYQEIGEKFGVNESTIRSDVMMVTARNVLAANDLWATERAIAMRRIEAGMKTFMPLMLQGDIAASKEARGWEALHIKICGLDQDLGSDTPGTNDEREQRIVRMLTNPSERLKPLLVEAIRAPGSTLLRVINEIVRTMPIETTAESAE